MLTEYVRCDNLRKFVLKRHELQPDYKRVEFSPESANPEQPISKDASAIKFEDTRSGFPALVLDPKLTA
jgi:hypothetical protein